MSTRAGVTTPASSESPAGVVADGLGSIASRVPAAYFGIVLGLVGSGNAWRGENGLWHLSRIVGETIMALAVATWTNAASIA